MTNETTLPNATMVNEIDMTATAIATQKLDSVDRPGWLKVVAPAKVNLVLGIGARREDGAGHGPPERGACRRRLHGMEEG